MLLPPSCPRFFLILISNRWRHLLKSQIRRLESRVRFGFPSHIDHYRKLRDSQITRKAKKCILLVCQSLRTESGQVHVSIKYARISAITRNNYFREKRREPCDFRGAYRFASRMYYSALYIEQQRSV